MFILAAHYFQVELIDSAWEIKGMSLVFGFLLVIDTRINLEPGVGGTCL